MITNRQPGTLIVRSTSNPDRPVKQKIRPIPIIDLFAGPGGLSEGFSELCHAGRHPFTVALSIEKDEIACSTLTLRKFRRAFTEAPDEYLAYVKGELSLSELYDAHPMEARAAQAKTWQAELGVESSSAVTRRVRAALGHTDQPWVLIGGPPCQAYSLVGRARMRSTRPNFEDDKRHFLYREYLQIVARHRPAVFVMENVRGILSSKHDGNGIFERIIKDLRRPTLALGLSGHRSLGYRLYGLGAAGGREFIDGDDPAHHFLLRAEDHHIPQSRHRVFIVGVRSDVKGIPEPLDTSPRHVSVASVLGDLPTLRSRLSKARDSRETWIEAVREARHAKWMQGGRASTLHPIVVRTERALISLAAASGTGAQFVTRHRNGIRDTTLAKWYRKGATGLTLHQTRGHMQADLHRYLFASSFADVTGRSPSLRDFPVELRPRHANVEAAVKGEMFGDRFRVQTADRPSSTVTSHISKDGHYFIHYGPEQCRSLTVREAARLQTFPDDYFFCGNRTEQYHQVGNAVPPMLALQVGTSIAAIVSKV